MRTDTFIDKRKKAFNISGRYLHLIIILLILSGSIMIGHGARMMYQGLFHPESYYPAPTPQTLDFYFDWLTLTALGFFTLIFAFYNCYKHYKNLMKDTKANRMS